MDITNNNNNLMDRFPICELSYGSYDHKKVQYDICLAVPFGKKVYAWFTYYKKDYVCILIEKIRTRDGERINKIEIVSCVFSPDLCLNTILYGTIVNYDNVRFFCIEDICYYKNKNICKIKNEVKFNKIRYILQHEMSNTCYLKNNVVFQMCYMSSNYDELYNYVNNLPYKIYSIQYISLQKRGRVYNVLPRLNKMNSIYNEQRPLRAVFKVKAEIQFDIYNLYCYNEGDTEYYVNKAYIPDYKTSVKMNSIFRIIKENDNLDYLEESDDEEEFENIDIDKYVDLNKTVYMECIYTPKFKRWIPDKILKPCKTVKLCDVGNLIRDYKKRF